MTEEIKEILDKFSNRKKETLIQGLRECQLKDIEHPFITREEYIDKILDYITNLQQENKLNEEDKKWFIEKTAQAEVDSKYKTRCEKAMEVLKLPIVYETHQENGERDELLKKIRQAKDILNGSDENE